MHLETPEEIAAWARFASAYAARDDLGPSAAASRADELVREMRERYAPRHLANVLEREQILSSPN